MRHITNATTIGALTMFSGSVAVAHNLKNPKPPTPRGLTARNMTDDEAARANKKPSRQVRRAYERARAKGQPA